MSSFLTLTLLVTHVFAESGYQAEAIVSNPTRLDWTFVLANQSVVDPPADWLRGYDSTQQRYERFIPPGVKGKSDGLPVVIFISASDSPAGWSQLESVCKQKGILFASPYGAGNQHSHAASSSHRARCR